MNNSLRTGIVIAVIVAVAIGIVAYYMGATASKAVITAEQEKAAAEAQAQETLATKAGEETAKGTNLFQTTANPLENVADPLQKAKEVLNPFE